MRCAKVVENKSLKGKKCTAHIMEISLYVLFSTAAIKHPTYHPIVCRVSPLTAWNQALTVACVFNISSFEVAGFSCICCPMLFMLLCTSRILPLDDIKVRHIDCGIGCKLWILMPIISYRHMSIWLSIKACSSAGLGQPERKQC